MSVPPSLLLSLLLGAIYGTAFFVWRGKKMSELIFYLIAGVLGFVVGQAAGNLIGLEIGQIGPLHIPEATVTSWVILFLAQWLKG